MKQFVRSHKLVWNLGFWILFFVLVFFTLIKPEIVGIPKIYFGSLVGVLLIVNRIYLVKGSIKRLPYFLSILALLLILIILCKISGSSLSFFELFFLSIISFMFSYFFLSSYFILPIAMKISDLVQSNLSLEISTGLIRTSIVSFLCLVIFYPFVVLHIKRLRDIRYSYWWTLFTVVPGIHILFEIFLFLKGSAKKKSKQPKRSSQHKQNKSKRKMRR